MMSEQTFDARLKHIEEQYQARREGADAYRDQEMARLFESCEWTQERIAQHMGKKQQWVSLRLVFGRFLGFTTTGCEGRASIVANLTERRFREHWKRTKGKEAARFEQVLHALEHGIPQGIRSLQDKPGIKKATVAALEDGRWHTVQQLTAEVEETLLGVTEGQVRDAVNQMIRRPSGTHRLESKKIGKKCQYRLTRKKPDRQESPVALQLYERAEPLIKELEEIGQMHEARMSPIAVRMIAVKLRRLFDSVLETATA